MLREPEPPRPARVRWPRRVLGGSIAAVIGWCGFVASLRSTGTDAHPVLIGLVGITPLAMLPIWLAVPFALIRRRMVWVVPVVVLCAAQVVWARAEWRLGGPSAQPTPASNAEDLVVATGNVLIDNPTPELFVNAVLQHNPDVLLLQELTPDAWRRIQMVEAIDDYPFRIVDPQRTGLGSAILSRLPLRNRIVIDRDITRWTTAEVQAVGGEWVTIVNVHTTSPLGSTSIERWQEELGVLSQRAKFTDGHLILAGDFNATVHHDEFRQILESEMVDAHQQVGSGLGRTWSLRGIPLMGLDHVLVSDGLEPRRVWSVNAPGSDHRPLVTVVDVIRE